MSTIFKVMQKSPERQLQERQLLLNRERRIRLCRADFWEYCHTESPEFYTAENWHLRLLCWVLQALYEKRLTKDGFRLVCDLHAPVWFIDSFDWDRMQAGRIYKKLMINIPPRLGKSRTLVNFCKWALGKDRKNKIITGSYNDDMAKDFSKYTRNGIQAEKSRPQEIVYSDIFPESRIQYGDAAYGQWALEGSFFSYKGAGVGGGVTGKGCNISIVDDPVKDANEAFNESRLETIWTWYASTFNSRLEKGGIRIVNMTRWAEKDICGRLLDTSTKEGKRAHEWFVLTMTACDDVRENGTKQMLCPALLDWSMYCDLKDTLDESIFDANYKQMPVDKKGRMYPKLLTYKKLPRDEDGNIMFDKIIAYTDTADEGGDYLASIVAGLHDGYVYVLDVLYTKAPMEETEPATADMLYRNDVNFARFESNNGGRGFARNVERILYEKHGTRKVEIKWFHQSKNKDARIFSQSHTVARTVLYPHGWGDKWPEYYQAMTKYKSEGKNAHDDAPDATTGLVEEAEKQGRRKARAVSF